MEFDENLLAKSTANLRSLYAYWKECCGDRRMPSRRDFDPMHLPRLLPGVLLIDVEAPDESGRPVFRYRVVGGWEVDARGHNPTGKTVDEGFHGESLESARRDYETVCRMRAPLYGPLDFVDRRGVRFFQDSIVLPLSEDGETVSQILVYSERRDWQDSTLY